MALRSSAGRLKNVSVPGLGLIAGGSVAGDTTATLLRLDSSNCLLLRLRFLNMVANNLDDTLSEMDS